MSQMNSNKILVLITALLALGAGIFLISQKPPDLMPTEKAVLNDAPGQISLPDSLDTLESNQALVEQQATAKDGEPEEPLFIGVQEVAPDRVVSLLPEAAEGPVLLEFRSKFCLDCQRMAPVLDTLFQEFQGVKPVILDVKKAKDTPVMKAFQPTIVPVILFIEPGGQIHNVLYGFQEKHVLRRELKHISEAA